MLDLHHVAVFARLRIRRDVGVVLHGHAEDVALRDLIEPVRERLSAQALAERRYDLVDMRRLSALVRPALGHLWLADHVA